MRVNIEDVMRIIEERRAINSIPFRDIEWYENNEKLEIDEEILEEFEMTGLNNIDFIGTNFFSI